MILKITKYLDYENIHECVVESGGKLKERLKVDVMVDGYWPDGTDPKSLVGKTISVREVVPYQFIAQEVRESAERGDE